MDRSQLQFRKRHSDSIDRCLSAVELAIVDQAGDKAASAIISCLAEIARRETGNLDGESLYDLGLDLRTVNGLEAAGVFSVTELSKLTATDIFGMGNFGATTLARIQDGLSARGLCLAIPERIPTPGGTAAPFRDSIYGDAELAKYKTGLTDCVKRGIVAGGNEASTVSSDSRQEASKTPCEEPARRAADFKSNSHVGLFPKPKRKGLREDKLIAKRRHNAAVLAKKLAGRQKKRAT